MKKLSSIVVLALAAVVLVGCGDDSSEANQVLEPGQAEAPSGPTAPGGGGSGGPEASATTEVQLD